MRRLTHIAFALAVLAAVLSPAALASGVSRSTNRHHSPSDCASGGPSAICVYYDGGPRGAGGSSLGGKPGTISPRLARLISRYGGKDRRLLEALAEMPIFGHPEPGGQGAVNGSSALGAILDIGAGPLALFATLLAGAAAFAVARTLRRRRGAQP